MIKFSIRLIGIVLVTLCLTLFPDFLFSQTKISGVASFAKSQKMRVQTYDDLISYKIKTIKEVQLDRMGKFDFEINIQKPTYLFFVINFINGQLMIEPGKKYVLDFSVDSTYQNPAEISVQNVPMWIEIIEPKTGNLMSDLTKMENLIEDFLSINNRFQQIYFLRNKATLDSLNQLLNAEFKSKNNPYLQTYLKYRFGQVDYIMRSKMTDVLYKEYLTENEIPLENIAYMQFFNEFFNRYIQSANSKIPNDKLIEFINEKPDYFQFLDYLGKDPILVNEIIRELVIIKNLAEMFNIVGFNKDNIIKLLYELSVTTKFEEHKRIATNVIEMLVKQQTGYTPKAKELKDVSGNIVNIDKYKGKILYINFFSVDCIDCVMEFFAIQKLKKDFGDKMNFISVSMDVNSVKLFHFVNKYTQFDWPILSFGNNYDWVEAYDIQAFPAQVLLDENGKILAYPAPLASGELSRYLYAFFMEDFRQKPVFIPGSSVERDSLK